jgi:hypothetical protein
MIVELGKVTEETQNVIPVPTNTDDGHYQYHFG